MAIVQRLRQVPVIQRRERLDPGRQKLVDETVVKSTPFGFGWPVPSGKIRGHEIENRYAVAPNDLISATSSL